MRLVFHVECFVEFDVPADRESEVSVIMDLHGNRSTAVFALKEAGIWPAPVEIESHTVWSIRVEGAR